MLAYEDVGAQRSPVRVALLGAGGIATSHILALRSLRGARIVGLADLHEGRAEALRSRWQLEAPAFGSLASMLAATRPDVVHILLPPELHAENALACLAAGAHVFVEKPLCVSEEECVALETAARLHQRRVGVNHNATFEEQFRELVAAIRGRRLGAIQHVAVQWSVPFGAKALTSSWYQRAGKGVVFLESGSHPMSLIVRLVGEATAATAVVSSAIAGHPDTWQASLACTRGTAQCYLAIGRTFTEQHVHVIGEDGSAFVDLRLGYVAVTENTRFSPLLARVADTLGIAQSIAAAAARGLVHKIVQLPSAISAPPSMSASIGAFYDALRADARPPASLDDGVAVVRSCLRVIAAARAPHDLGGR